MSGLFARLALCLVLLAPLGAQPAPPEATAFQITVDHAGVTTSGGVLMLQQTPLWSATLTGAVSYAVIAGGRVFATAPATPGNSYGTVLYAFDALTGKPLWAPVPLSGTYYWSNLTYEGGKLFVVNFDGLLRSYDAATGAPGWSAQLPGQYAFTAPPTASGGIVYVGGAGSGGTLYAVSEADGTVLWTAPVANGDASSPAVGPHGVYVSYPCQVYDFDLASGAPNWAYNGPCDGGGGYTPVYANGLLYVRDSATAPPGRIYDAATGAAVGQFAAVPAPAVTASSAFYVNGGTLAAVDLASGNPLWSFAGDSSLVTAPIVLDRSVIVGSSRGNLYALDAGTGQVTWQVKTPSPINGSSEGGAAQPDSGLAVADGILAVPAGNQLIVYSIFGPPAPPANLAATPDVDSVSLTWTAAAGATSYNIYQGTSPGAESATPAATGVTDTNTTITGLTAGTSYYFVAKSVGGGVESAASNEASAVPLLPIANPGPPPSSGGGGILDMLSLLGLGLLAVQRTRR